MTKNRTPTPVYLDPGMHPGLEVKGLMCFDICIAYGDEVHINTSTLFMYELLICMFSDMNAGIDVTDGLSVRIHSVAAKKHTLVQHSSILTLVKSVLFAGRPYLGLYTPRI